MGLLPACRLCSWREPMAHKESGGAVPWRQSDWPRRLVTTLVANFVLDEISPNLERVEALIYVQTSPEILVPVNEGLQMADRRNRPRGRRSWRGRMAALLVLATDARVVGGLEVGQRPPLVFCGPEKEPTVRRRLGAGYESVRLPLRSWWVMEDFKPSLVDILRYVFTRRPWGTIGSTDTILLRDTGEEIEEAAKNRCRWPCPLRLASRVRGSLGRAGQWSPVG